MSVGGVGVLGDGLAVVHLGRADVRFNLELALEAVDDDLKVELAHTLDDGLVGLLVAGEVEGRILLSELDKAVGHLLEVRLGLGLHRNLDHGIGELHALQDDLLVLVAEGVAGGGVLETRDGDDVTGDGLVDILTGVGVHLEEAADALLLALDRVVRVGALLKLARVDAHEGEGADEGIRHDLEGETGERLLVGGLAGHLLLGVIDGGAVHVGEVGGRGEVVNDGVEHGLDALVLERRAAHDGDEGVGDGTLADALLELLVGRLLALEVGLHGLVVLLHSLLDEHHAVLLRLLLEVVGNIGDIEGSAELLAVPLDGLHLDEVNDARELLLGADGELDDEGIGAEVGNDHVHAAVKVGSHAVHLVDEAHAGDAVLVSLAPDGLRLGLDARDGVEAADGAVEDAEGTLNLEREVDVARGVDDVDAVVLPRAGGGRGGDGDTALLLLLHPVHGGSTLVHLTDLVGLTGVVEDALGGGGLAGVNVRHDTDVAVLVDGHIAASRADDEGGRAAGRLAGGRDASGGADALGAKAGEAGKLRGAGSGRAASVKRKFAAQLAAFGAATSVQSPLSTGFVTRKPGARAR